MTEALKSRPRRRRQPLRRLTLFLMRMGISGEIVAVTGMALGILAGAAFMGTGEASRPDVFWSAALIMSVLRIVCIRLDHHFRPLAASQYHDEVFFSELPERVSDAMTLIGFGFAVDSNPWLGLAAALAAIFSAYISSIAYSRGAGRKTAFSGPMNRVNRLIILSVTSLLMIFGISNERLSTPIPEVALWVIVIGCVATVLIRWIRLREIKV